jgi:hypothetical protein
MDNDSGRGSRSDKPPPLATVRRLRLDEYTSRSGAAEDDWYETERLTGQITGRAPSTAATDEPAAAPDATLVLDWRNPSPDADAGVAPRRRRSLDRRRRPKVTLRVPRPRNSLRRRWHAATAAEVPAGEADSTTSSASEMSGARDDAAAPLLGFRHALDPELPEARRALGARFLERVPRLAWERGASILAATLVAAAAIGIAAALSGSPAKPHRAAVGAAGSVHAPDLGAAATALTAAVALAEHQIGAKANAQHAVRARRAHRAAARRSHRAHQHPPKSRSAAPPPASTSSSSGSSSSSPTYSGATSAASTSSQSGTTEPTSATSTQHTQSTQPAFGQNGSLGPGRGAAGTQ